MTQEQIEGNKLIAEFMGGKLKHYNLSNEPYYQMPNKQQWMPERLIYYSSWDWLMPVVEKIEKLGLKCEIGIASCVIYSAKYNVEKVYAETKIKATWLAVVEFIKWYNQTKQL